MSRKREIAALIAASVVGIVIIGVVGYVLYDRLPEPQPVPAIPTRLPTAIEGESAAALTRAPTFTPVPPTAISMPAATMVQATSCVDGMRLVQHLSYDPQRSDALNSLRANRRFTKSWRIQNTGTCLWDPGYSIVYESGNHAAAHMNGTMVVTHGRTAPKETYDVQVKLISPSEPGSFVGYWRIRNASGTYFGDRLPVVISVVAPIPPTREPTWTPRPETTIQFGVDRSRVARGECAVFSWSVSNAQAVYFNREGQAWQAHGVSFSGQSTECPLETTAYQLRVVRQSGWVDIRRLTVHIVQPPGAPQITRFTVEPAQVPVGACVTARWEIQGQDTRVRLLRDGGVRWDGAPSIGSLYDCPTRTGQAVYTLEAVGPGGTTSMQRFVYIGSTPAPTLLSGTAWQVLAIGNSVPAGPAVTAFFGQQDAGGQGSVSGWGSCNTYTALYQQSGTLLTIGSSTVGGNVCTTEMVAQERALLDALYATASFSWTGGQLTLWNSTGEVVLNLAAIRATAP